MEITKPEDNNTQDQSEPDPDKRPIAFIINDANQIRHDFRVVDIGSVSAIIKKGNVERPDVPVVIQAADGAHTGIVIRIFDEAKKVGFPNEKIIVTPKR